VIALVNGKNVKRTFRYGPYGENIKSEGEQSIPFPFGFKGGYRMPGGNVGEGNVANGLYHFGQRYYDPTTGRWTQLDPSERVASAKQGNRFLFAGADPINRSDPSGRQFIEEVEEVGEEAVEGVAACGKGALTSVLITGDPEAAPGGCAVGAASYAADKLGLEEVGTTIDLGGDTKDFIEASEDDD
jgi:RHS repeat-associated protein